MIFYFSATGNSRHVAERVAAETGDGAVSVTDIRNGRIDIPAADEVGEAIGIVTPTYSWGLPVVMREFLLDLAQGPVLDPVPGYLWFAATYGTTPGQTGRFAEEILRRGGLAFSAKFGIRMPDTWTPIFDLSDKERVSRTNEAADRQIDDVAEKVRSRTCGDFMRRKTPWLLTKAVYGLEYDSMRRTSNFTVEDTCVGCGLCARRCPVGAIEMRDKRPVWVADRCAACLGCLHHCPKFAIQYGKRTKAHGQYAHP